MSSHSRQSLATQRTAARQAEASGSQRQSSVRNQRGVIRDEQDDADEEDAALEELTAPLAKPQIDEQYRHQPLEKSTAAASLNRVVKDMTATLKTLNDSMSILGDAACDLQEALASLAGGDEDDDEDAPQIQQADRDFRALVDAYAETTVQKEALDEIRHKIQIGDPVRNALAAYESQVAEGVAAYKEKTARQKYLNHDRYKEFRDSLWEATGRSGPRPNLKTLISREDGDEESDDEDVEIAEGQQNVKDPISLVWLVKPVKHPGCKHVYSRESITSYIKQGVNKREIECPVTGCSKIVKLDTLVDDKQLERRVQARLRREQDSRRQANEYQDMEDDDEEEEG